MLDIKCVAEGELVEISVPMVSDYTSISSCDSAAFWALANDAQTSLELLVKMFRLDTVRDDKRKCDDLFEIITTRIKRDNQRWAYWKLRAVDVPYAEIPLLQCDLCADLDLAIYCSLIDKEKYYWEEKFSVCLYFERKRVFSCFMRYECFWKPAYVEQGMRIPRSQIISIDQIVHNFYREDFPIDIEDDRAQKMMYNVELSYVWQCVLTIPYPLRVVICLIYWNGKSKKEIAQLLHVSDRTVRNRLHTAYKLLREALENDFFYV